VHVPLDVNRADFVEVTKNFQYSSEREFHNMSCNFEKSIRFDQREPKDYAGLSD